MHVIEILLKKKKKIHKRTVFNLFFVQKNLGLIC